MKLSLATPVPSFKPINITIETEQELLELTAVLEVVSRYEVSKQLKRQGVAHSLNDTLAHESLYELLTQNLSELKGATTIRYSVDDFIIA